MKLNSLFDYYCLSSPEFGVVSFGGGSGIDKGRKRGGGGGGVMEFGWGLVRLV